MHAAIGSCCAFCAASRAVSVSRLLLETSFLKHTAMVIVKYLYGNSRLGCGDLDPEVRRVSCFSLLRKTVRSSKAWHAY